MPTRYDGKGESRFGVAPLPTGYDGQQSPTLNLPAVGIEDVDRALFNLFNNEIRLAVKNKDGIKDVPVVFAAGEKWALLRKGAPRDKNGTLILPIVVIGRTALSQSPNEDIAGRGINQQTGDIVIRRRLDSSNRGYQSLVNRFFVRNQLNVAVNIDDDDPIPGQLTTTRDIGELRDDGIVSSGGLFKPDKRTQNVWETIVIPAPQFFTATYEVIVWAQYVQQMNSIIQSVISSFLPQGNQWRLDTETGYWFIGTVDGNVYNAQNNFEDMSQEERIIKYQFSIKVPAYILAADQPGAPVPVRRYVSNPDITFSIASDVATEGVIDPFLGADDPTLPYTNEDSGTPHQRRDGKTKLYPGKVDGSPHDPALESYGRNKPGRYKKIIGIDGKGNAVTKYSKIKTVNNFSGETVFSGTELAGLSIVIADD